VVLEIVSSQFEGGRHQVLFDGEGFGFEVDRFDKLESLDKLIRRDGLQIT